MQNYLKSGETLTLTAPYTVSSGDGALVGSIFGVATSDVTSGDEGEFMTVGVFELAKTTSQAWTVGDKLYWNNSTKKLTTDGTAGMLVGVCAEADAGSSDTTGYCKLNDGVPSSSEGPQAAIADLGGSMTGTTDGDLADIAASAGACAGGNDPTAAQVDTAIATAVATIVTGTNTNLKELQSKLNTLLAELRIAGIIAT